jgi:phytoene dehydrogenase-like protein
LPEIPSSQTRSSTHYDVAVIGAGLSGLSSALRLAMFGKKVVLLEKHFVVGGLNSFYAKKGIKFDVGLHALTNYPSQQSGKSSPLLKLCRQLRIPLDSLNLLPQSHSRITFGNENLLFDNNFEFFLSQVEEKFPKERDRFQSLLAKMDAFPAYSVDAEELSTRRILKESIRDPLLSEMLLCPTCYYGSARKNDIDFPTFVMLFDAIFKQGLARPEQGIQALLNPIVSKLKELGVDRRMNTSVKAIKTNGAKVSELELENGNLISADFVISTCGALETEALLVPPNASSPATSKGKFSIMESIFVFQGSPRDFGWEETIVFFNDSETFCFDQPDGLIDLRSGVICMPENYAPPDPVSRKESKLRITHPANFDLWSTLEEDSYESEKELWEERILQEGLEYLPEGQSKKKTFSSRIILRDTFTPRTIKKYTGHVNGALYGSPQKRRDGATAYENLFLAGTDQGYIGIVGAMLGGIAVANNQILRSG